MGGESTFSIFPQCHRLLFKKIYFFSSKDQINRDALDCTETTSVAAVQAAYVCHAAAIVAITTSGRTAKICAKYRPQCPIIAVTRFPQVARQINLHRGIFPLLFKGA